MLIFGKKKLQELCIQAYITPGGEHSCDTNFGTSNLFVKIEKGA